MIMQSILCNRLTKENILKSKENNNNRRINDQQ